MDRVAVSWLLPLVHVRCSLDILVMGDWGGQPIAPYSTVPERHTADIMSNLAADLDVDMVWGLGDNMYEEGVDNEFDPRFHQTFETVFDSESLANTPFYMIAGNHDHYGNVSGQIMYSNHSARWTFPHLWYTKTFNVPDTAYTLQLVMIDTVILSGLTHSQHYCDLHGITDCIIHPRAPLQATLARNQYEWIEDTLSASTADFIVVAGHYPIWSIAEHGSTQDLVDNLKPMLQRNGVAAYLCGHDHTFQYINTGDGIDYVVAGGTHLCDPSTDHIGTIPRGSLKFHGCDQGGLVRISVDAKGLTTYFYYGSSNQLQYSTAVQPPRNDGTFDEKIEESTTYSFTSLLMKMLI